MEVKALTYGHLVSQQNARSVEVLPAMSHYGTRVKYHVLLSLGLSKGFTFAFVTLQGQVHKSTKAEIRSIPFSGSNHE